MILTCDYKEDPKVPPTKFMFQEHVDGKFKSKVTIKVADHGGNVAAAYAEIVARLSEMGHNVVSSSSSIDYLFSDGVMTEEEVFKCIGKTRGEEIIQRGNKEKVRELGDEIGYGALMQSTSIVWQEEHGSSACVPGPCKASVETCVCIDNPTEGHCDWCCGCGWLTKAVKELVNGIQST